MSEDHVDTIFLGRLRPARVDRPEGRAGVHPDGKAAGPAIPPQRPQWFNVPRLRDRCRRTCWIKRQRLLALLASQQWSPI